MVASIQNSVRIAVFTILSLSALSLSSCIKEEYSEDANSGLVVREFEASFADESTKTALVDGRKVQWKAGDIIHYYSYSSAADNVRSFSVSKDGTSARLSLKTFSDAGFVAAVYGAESLASTTSSSLVLDGVVRAEQSGRFDDAHVSVAYTKNIASERLSFYNLTSLLSFRLQRSDIAYVLFKPATAVPSGKARISFSGGRPGVTPQGSNLGAIKVFTSSGAGEYYISMFPGTISGGFEMEFYDYTNSLLGTAKSSKNLSLKVNTILNLGVLDNKISEPEQHGGTDSGLYMGITGFNAFLYKYPIQLLNSSSVQGFYSFIDVLPQKNVTMLYYSVKDAIKTLQTADYPSDLSTVAIVTFTDGEDDGSLDYESYMGSESEYLNNVNSLLYNSAVRSEQIKAWTIGLQSEDASNPAFLTHLQKLSRPSSNGVRVRNMDAVNKQFQSIADELVNSFNVHNLVVRIAGKSYGQKIRFTLDSNISNPAYSKIYIEGYYNNQNKTLYNVSYHGLTAESGADINSILISDERLYEFSFLGLVPDDHSELLASNVIQWTWETDSGTYWKRRSEMEKDENRRIETVRKSAVILLNLDCTTSLNGSLFTELKGYAKDFIARLKDAAYSPDVVSSVTLGNTLLTLGVAASKQLTATVQPSTATNKKVSWSSSDPSVATVDAGGVVRGLKPGVATITVTTEMGGKQAICNVCVVEPEIVDLGLSVKWASWNVGASSPEEYGDYFAWGETEPKTAYSWATYKWCNGSNSTLTKYNTNSSYGTVDNKTQLDLADDAARVNWGGAWRKPSDAEWTELMENCTWTLTIENGVYGGRVKSNKSGYTNKSIFLPAAGYRGINGHTDTGNDICYWSSSLGAEYPYLASSVGLKSGSVAWYDDHRYLGLSVRPVFDDPEVPVSSVSLDTSTLTFDVAESKQLIATVYPSNATNRRVIWSSSNPSVVAVDETGYLSAVSPGSATVTVTSLDGGFTASCFVSVNQPVVQVSLYDVADEIWVGERVALRVKVFPENAADKSIYWESSDTSILSVNDNGEIMGKKAGMANITARSTAYPHIYDTTPVTVRQHITSVSLSLSHLILSPGAQHKLSVSLLPIDAAIKDVIWTSSNPDVAEVSDEGVVTALKKGSAIIGVESVDGGLTSSCDVEVYQMATNLKLNESDVTMYVGDAKTLIADVEPADAEIQDLDWKSSNDAVATVLNGTVTAHKAGESTIVASTKDGSNLTQMCHFTILQRVEGITLNSTQCNLEIGETIELRANVLPSNAFNKDVIWSSSDESVATVNSSGVVTGVSKGQAQISVVTKEGNFEANCIVNVTYLTSPRNLTLAIREGDTRYYLTKEMFAAADLSDCAVDGLCIIGQGNRFIISMVDQGTTIKYASSIRWPVITPPVSVSGSGFTFFSAKDAPTRVQAEIIVNNISDINTALVSFGGVALKAGMNYWTSYFTGARYYFYTISGSFNFDTTGKTLCQVRSVVANL